MVPKTIITAADKNKILVIAPEVATNISFDQCNRLHKVWDNIITFIHTRITATKKEKFSHSLTFDISC